MTGLTDKTTLSPIENKFQNLRELFADIDSNLDRLDKAIVKIRISSISGDDMKKPNSPVASHLECEIDEFIEKSTLYNERLKKIISEIRL